MPGSNGMGLGPNVMDYGQPQYLQRYATENLKMTKFELGPTDEKLKSAAEALKSLSIQWPKDTTTWFHADEVSGFYYDEQLKDPARVISLHPSTYLSPDKEHSGYLKWESFKEGDNVFEFSSMGLRHDSEPVYYSTTPIAVGFLSEDISFSASNEFTDSNGGDAISDFMKSMKPYAALAHGLKDAGLTAEKIKDEQILGGAVSSGLNSAMEWIGEIAEGASDRLNRHLMISGTKFTTYNGSNFNANNLELKFIKFSDWVYDPLDKKWKFESVTKYINSIKNYAFGTYVPFDVTDKDTETSAPNYLLKLFPEKLKQEGKKFINNMCGWQFPPGGFDMGNARNLDIALKGTLRLNIGNLFAIENLLIKNLSFTFSKTQVKMPYSSSDPEGGKVCPLYVEVILSLAPASMITDRTLTKILNSEGLNVQRSTMAYNLSQQITAIEDQRKGLKK